ncbi:NAD(P)-dependent oxidoreductase [Rhizobium sp. NPDC090275]|uniref:NAD(P)-dependent oxidoreductase n=1 Tax=Rhizobium sp. NPDC090275 TaxID=3364498 RepID=UPI00383BC832
MSDPQRLVILNQLGPELGKALEEHPSRPVVIQDSFPAEPWKIAPDADILVTGGFANWKQAPRDWRFPERLKWVQSQTTGIEIYPPPLLQGRVMTCGRGLNALPIAEFVFAAILRSEKRLEETRARSEADWRRHDIGRLYGKTLGLIGYGSLGQAIARRALAFDMNVMVNRRTAWEGERGITAAGIHEILAVADHLVIAAPLTAETEGMIDADLLRAAKPGLHLINISRGGLIGQEALVAALMAGYIGSATLDVTTPEPLPDGHPLYTLPNVFISPHISWAGGDQDQAFQQRLMKNLDAYLKGEELEALVDPVRGY